MTPVQLTAALKVLLADVLGTYNLPGMPSLPAIYLGNPPSDWTASGLEVIVSTDPDFDNTALYGPESNLEETNIVRLVAHGPVPLAPAVRRIVRKFSGCSTATVPANEQLGILNQIIIRIPR